MSNWTGAARSSYVVIKDEEAMRNALKHFDIKIFQNTEGLFAFSGDSDSGGWPSFTTDEDDEEIEFDPAIQIAPYMADDQVLVMMQSGHEQLRYVDGHANAYNSKGEHIGVSLNDIYRLAVEKFGIEPTSASY